MASVFLYTKLFAAFRSQYPSIHIEMLEASTKGSQQLVREGKLDTAIVIHDSTLPDLFQFTPIMETNIVGCVSVDHPLVNCAKIFGNNSDVEE